MVFSNLELFYFSLSNKYIDNAMDMLNINNQESWFYALNYLNSIDELLKLNTEREIHIFKAMLYELIEDFQKANSEYKEALNIYDDLKTKELYRAFIDRANKFPIIYSNLNICKKIDKKNAIIVANKLSNMTKYYSKSKKGLKIAQKYCRELLDIYEDLAQNNPKEFTPKYLESLKNYYALTL